MIATLFDFDGVLVDSEPVHLAAFNDVLAPYGIDVAEREYFESLLSLDDVACADLGDLCYWLHCS